MATAILPRDEVFLDTTYAVAISSPSDQLHLRALELAAELERAKAKIVTTRGVMLEIGNALSKRRYRSAAVRLLRGLRADPNVEIVSLTDELFDKALDLFLSRMDKEWGMIDCVSFVVMTNRGMTKALAADDHFEQAGFQALLRDH